MSGGLHETAETARDLAQTLEHSADALDKASRTADAVGQKVDRVTDAIDGARDTIVANARQHPMAAVATAVAIGFVMGRMGG